MRKIAVFLILLLAIGGLLAWRVHDRGVRQRALQQWYRTGAKAAPAQTMELNVMVLGYNGQLAGLPQQAPPVPIARFPVVLSLAGCGYAQDTKGIPAGVAVLSASERMPNGTWRGLDACARRDGPALEQLYQRELAALLRAARSRAWFDEKRIILRGYGEAAPVAAAHRGPSLARVLLGEPCLVPWRDVVAGSPITLLVTSPAAGMLNDPEAGPPYTCTALPRPVALRRARTVVAPGRITPGGIPMLLADGRDQAYQRALGEE